MGGVSWSESRVVDDNGSDAKRAAARSKDTESGWQDLVEDEKWDPEMGVGGWSFLDSIGFRYYLPAAMARSIKCGYNVGIQFHLTLPKYGLRKYTLKQWSALNLDQRVCIKHFLQYMVAISSLESIEFGSVRMELITMEMLEWEECLTAYWADVDR